MYSICKVSCLNSNNIAFVISECRKIITFTHKGRSNALAALPKYFYMLHKDDDIFMCAYEEPKFNKMQKFFVSLVGTYRSLCKNVVHGFVTGYSVSLRVEGVGYKVVMNEQQNCVNCHLRFSHVISVSIPTNVNVVVANNGISITISGYDKQSVTALAAKFIKLRKRSPYKKAGIYYADETVVIKSINKK